MSIIKKHGNGASNWGSLHDVGLQLEGLEAVSSGVDGGVAALTFVALLLAQEISEGGLQMYVIE